jgi:hypothetical protein
LVAARDRGGAQAAARACSRAGAGARDDSACSMLARDVQQQRCRKGVAGGRADAMRQAIDTRAQK